MEPLVPADVDLRGLPYMPLDVGRLRDSQLAIGSSGDEFRAAVLLWCASWNQVPAASLPNDDVSLAAYAGFGKDLKAWKKVKSGAMRGFVQCSDGRFYHPVVAEKAIEAWESRVEYREISDSKSERQKRWRERCKALCDQLRGLGIAPPKGASIETLERLLVDARETSTSPSTVDEVEIAYKGREEKVRDIKASLSPSVHARDRDDAGASGSDVVVTDIHGNPTTSIIAELTPAQSATVVTVCKALRKMGGSPRFHPGDELLAALAIDGFTAEQVVRCGGEKALRDAGLWNDPDVHPDLFDLLVNGATQQEMGLTQAQYTALRSAVAQVSIGYIAGALRGRRRDAANQAQQISTNSRGAGRRPSVTDNFEGKTYAGTAIDKLPIEFRDAIASAGVNAGG